MDVAGNGQFTGPGKGGIFMPALVGNKPVVPQICAANGQKAAE